LADNDIDVSIILPVYNRAEDLHRCLRALAAQDTGEVTFEIIVVNNASTVPIEPIVRSYPSVIYTEETRPGVSKARNKGAALAKGHFLAFIDGDTFPDVQWLQCGYQFCTTHLVPGVVAAGRIQPYLEKNNFWERVDRESLNQRHFVNKFQMAACGNFWLLRSYFQELGGFDESLALYEDFDLTRRVRDSGGSVLYLHDAFVWHRCRSTWRSTYIRTLRQARALLVAFRRWGMTSRLKMAYLAVHSRVIKCWWTVWGLNEQTPERLHIRLGRLMIIWIEIGALLWFIVTEPHNTKKELALMQQSQE